jgi:hypothetical protein
VRRLRALVVRTRRQRRAELPLFDLYVPRLHEGNGIASPNAGLPPPFDTRDRLPEDQGTRDNLRSPDLLASCVRVRGLLIEPSPGAVLCRDAPGQRDPRAWSPGVMVAEHSFGGMVQRLHEYPANTWWDAAARPSGGARGFGRARRSRSDRRSCDSQKTSSTENTFVAQPGCLLFGRSLLRTVGPVDGDAASRLHGVLVLFKGRADLSSIVRVREDVGPRRRLRYFGVERPVFTIRPWVVHVGFHRSHRTGTRSPRATQD